VINILKLDDIRSMASNSKKHKVIMVGTGSTKTNEMRVALQTGFANVLILRVA
jgi:DNA-binding transcriptional regulator LsrR (DeoR family)